MLVGRTDPSVIGGICGVIVDEELAVVGIFATAGMVRATPGPLFVTLMSQLVVLLPGGGTLLWSDQLPYNHYWPSLMILVVPRNTFHFVLHMPLLVHPQAAGDPLAFFHPCRHHVRIVDGRHSHNTPHTVVRYPPLQPPRN